MKILFIMIFLFTFGCGQKTESLLLRESQLGSLKWNKSVFPLPMKISNSFDAPSQSLIGDMLTNWERNTQIDFFDDLEMTPHKEFSSLTDYYYLDPDVMGIYLATSPVEGIGKEYLAVAQLYYKPSVDEFGRKHFEISHADIVINGYDYKFSADPNCDKTFYLGTLILHELGHVLGLAHFKHGIMNEVGMTLEDNNVTLEEEEIQAVISKYAPPIAGHAISTGTQFDLSIDPKSNRILFYLQAMKK